MNKNINIQIPLAIIFISLQILIFINDISDGTIITEFKDRGIGYIIFGLIGTIVMVLEIKKRKKNPIYKKREK